MREIEKKKQMEIRVDQLAKSRIIHQELEKAIQINRDFMREQEEVLPL